MAVNFERYGKAHMVPGMKLLLEEMQAFVERFSENVAAEPLDAEEIPRRGRGRPPTKQSVNGKQAEPATVKKRASGWPADPAARKREMARRMRNRAKKAQEDDAAAKARKMAADLSRAARIGWEQLTPKQRKERIAKMQAGRAAQRTGG